MKKSLIPLTLLLVAGSAFAQKVTVNYDKSINFSKYKTFSWARGIPAKNPFINMMIVEGFERALSNKGLTKADNNGDLQLSLSVAVDVDIQVTHGGWGNNGSGLMTGIPSGSTSGAWDVRRGTIVLDMLDGTSQNLVWHGAASDTLSHAPTTDMNKDAKRAEKHVRNAVEKLMKKFPRSG